MFPYITIGTSKIYMTGIGIVFMLISFIIIVFYLSKKYKQNFRPFFYRIPILLFLVYGLGSYIDFALNVGIIPHGKEERLRLITPQGYNFHFIGILLGLIISFGLFLKKIKRYENKKVRGDILFVGTALSLVPLGFFLLLGDNFIGKPTTGLLGIQPLMAESELSKFTSVFPIGIFLSIGSLIILTLFMILKKTKKKFGFGILGFAGLLFISNIIFLFQQYPRYGIVSAGGISLDIKQHVSFLVIMLCLYIYHKRERYT